MRKARLLKHQHSLYFLIKPLRFTQALLKFVQALLRTTKDRTSYYMLSLGE